MKIGIIGAMQEEVALLKERMEVHEATEAFGMEYCAGVLGGQEVVVVVCGIGKVNAAVCAEVLVDRFAVTHLVFTGVAGSLDASIDIGDVVVSTDCVQHDFDLGLALGKSVPGTIPGFDSPFFVADAHLREVTVRAVREVAPEVGVWERRVASGDQFVSDRDNKERIVRTFGAACCEMEGAAVAQVATMACVPFVVVRAISDKADGSAEVDFATFAHEAANRSAAIVERMLELLV